MARPNKVGLDYFELDCHMDEKVELIEAEYGLKGFALVVKLYQGIYAGFGYYCEWTPDISMLWARRLGLTQGGAKGKLGLVDGRPCAMPGFPANFINNVVEASVRRGIFSEELFNRYHILTSSGIQKRYLNAVSRREHVELIKEYLLVGVGEHMKNVTINSVSGDKNAVYGRKSTQRREEKSKEEKSREKKKNGVHKEGETTPAPEPTREELEAQGWVFPD